MKSGKDIKYTVKFGPKHFEDSHTEPHCDGRFRIHVVKDGIIAVDSLGGVRVPAIPMAECPKCGAAFLLPKFKDWVEHVIAQHLVLSNGVLDKRQVRFLRLFFGETLEDWAKHIGVSDRHEMSKLESEKFPSRMLSEDKIVRLRLHCVELLAITDSKVLFQLNRVDDTRTAAIHEVQFPKIDESQFRPKLRRA